MDEVDITLPDFPCPAFQAPGEPQQRVMSDRSHPSVQPLVLAVGADALVRKDVHAGLTHGAFDVIDCETAAEAASFLLDTRPDLVLVDATLDGAHELVRSLTIASRAPILVLTSPYGVDRALASGASDCIVTPVHAALLRARVEFALRCSRAERTIERLARGESDPGGEEHRHGLLAYDAFVQRVDEELASARAGKGQVVVMYVHLDFTTALAGVESPSSRDRVLQVTVQRLKDSLRSRDTLGRPDNVEPPARAALVSDREIVVAFAGMERTPDAYKIARRLQQQLSQPIEIEHTQITLPTSLGIALHPDDGERVDTLVERARGAMQVARDEGRGTIRFARSELDRVIFERLSLEVHLREALERDQLLVHYQPRISIATGRVLGVEALVRWKHPELGLISPGHFIPIAEESGLILPIGEWVLRQACEQSMRWRAAGVEPIHMAVNLSPAQFREPDLVGVVRRALDDAGLEAGGLELELTESMLLGKGDGTVRTLESLKALGVGLSIDDFGTGYSSLNYIKRFPVDTLKIDQSFIRDMLTSEQDSTLTTSIVLMGKGLNLAVVAEGVETKSQLGLLRALGCDQAQGYLFSRPVPPDEIPALVATGFGSIVESTTGAVSRQLRS